MSKNLNRPFFMDFLTSLSVRYSDKSLCDVEDTEDEGEDILDKVINNSPPL